MTAELRTSPTKKEKDFYLSVQAGHIKKLSISASLGVVAAAATPVFPPAVGGVVVGMTETLRQFALFHKEFYQFHKKYTGVNKKS